MQKLVGWVATLSLHTWLALMALGYTPRPEAMFAPLLSAAGGGRHATHREPARPLPRPAPAEPPPWQKRFGDISLTRTDALAQQARVAAARRAGAQSALRRREAVARLTRQLHGDALAAVMQRPLADAWRELEARTLRGEAGAADALYDLAGRCPIGERDDAPPGTSREPAQVIQELSASLDPVASAYVVEAMSVEYALAEEDAAVCEAQGLGIARLDALLHARLATSPASTDAPMPTPREVSDRYLETFPRQARERPPWDTRHGDALDRLYATDEPLGAAEWQALLDAASGDAVVARALGSCLLKTCTGMPELDASQRELMANRAAALGHPDLLLELSGVRASPDHRVRAYAAAQYVQWLAASGCSAMPLTPQFAHASRVLATMQTELSAADRAAGTAQVNRWIAAAGPRALQLLGCDD